MSSLQNLAFLVGKATGQTLIMVFSSTFFSVLLGLPVGILLCTSDPAGIRPRLLLYQVLTRIVNVLRSFPFIILMILLFPLSRILAGTSIGTGATIIPLSIAAAPFAARLLIAAGLLSKSEDYGVLSLSPKGMEKLRRREKIMFTF